MKDKVNNAFENFEKEGLLLLICDCGYKFTKYTEFLSHQESCMEEGFDVYIGHRREECD